MAPTAPILDLSTLNSRPSIKIDGKLYELRTIEELSFLHGSDETARFNRLRQLMATKRKSKRTVADIKRALDDFCRLILLAPPKVHAALLDTHRAEIVNAFFTHQRIATKGPMRGRATRPAKKRSKSGQSSARG